MSVVLFICSGDALKELDFAIENSMDISEVYFHDIIYEKNEIMKSNIISFWVNEFKINESNINFSYNLQSLKENLGEDPYINYLIGLNIQELYSYTPSLSRNEIKIQFETQSKNRSLYSICIYLTKSPPFQVFIEKYDKKIEACFETFMKESEELMLNAKECMLI